jgi:plasmid maintenance system antidote protein VapI
MKTKELLKELIKENGLTNAGVAKAIDMTPQALWNLLNMGDRKAITVERTVQILDAMGYKVVVVPKAQTVKNGYEVEE